MNLMVLLLLFLVAAAAAFAKKEGETNVRPPKVTFFHGLNSQKSCIGSECFDRAFCYRGHNFLALNMAFTEIVAQVEFDTPVAISEVRLDSESEDEYSFRSLLMMHNMSPQERLLQRQTTGDSLMFRVYQLFTPKSLQEETAHLKSKRYEIKFSPFGMSCFQITGKSSHTDAVITLQARSLLDYKLAPLVGLGATLVLTAKRLSVMPEFYYLSGASIGVGFTVSVLVLCFFYLTNDRSSGGATSRSHFGIAALVQAAVVFMRKSIFDMMADYMEYVLLYVIVSFSLSLALIHYSLRTETGVVLNPALCDVLHVGLASLGAGIIGFTLTQSPRLQILLVLITALYTMLVSSRLFGNKQQNKPSQRKPTSAAYSTPVRRSNAEVLQTPEQALDFIAQNHMRFVLRKPLVEYEEEEELYESDSGEEEVYKQR